MQRFLLLNILQVPKIKNLGLNTQRDTPVNHMRSCLSSLGLLSIWFAASKTQ